MEDAKCPKCGSKKFKQEVEEIYSRYIDSCGRVVCVEDTLTHDLEFGKIRCLKCGQNCDNIFKNKEIKVSTI